MGNIDLQGKGDMFIFFFQTTSIWMRNTYPDTNIYKICIQRNADLMEHVTLIRIGTNYLLDRYVYLDSLTSLF